MLSRPGTAPDLRSPPPLWLLPLLAGLAGVPALAAPAQDAADAAPPPGTPGAAGDAGDSSGLSPVQRFRRGEMFFNYGDCQGTVDALASVAVPGALEDETALVEAYRMLAVCYFQLGRRDEVKQQLESLLSIKPEYALDPFRTPPPVMEIFDEAKRIIQAKLAAIESAREAGGTKPDKPVATILVERRTTVRESPFAAVFLPFGLSQWANGEVIKASILGALQGGALLTNIGAGIAAYAIDASDDDLAAHTNTDLVTPVVYSSVWLASAVGLAAFVGLYGYGVADAMWNYEDTKSVTTEETRRELSPAEGQHEQRRLDE